MLTNGMPAHLRGRHMFVSGTVTTDGRVRPSRDHHGLRAHHTYEVHVAPGREPPKLRAGQRVHMSLAHGGRARLHHPG